VQLALAEFTNARRLLDQARYGARLEEIRLQIASASLPSSVIEAQQ